jgi:uncharacterized damage-inducible protein DinB
MNARDVVTDLFGRLPELVRDAADGLTPEQLTTAPGPGANTVGWLLWHLTRVQDHHLTELVGGDQVWVGEGWAARFGLDPDPNNTGYGHTPAEVASVRPEGWQACVEYYEAVAARTDEFLAGVTDAGLDEVVDRRWDPPVTLGVRLVSVACDDLQHAGQAAYVRGLLSQ